MVSADAIAIAVSSSHNDIQLVVCHLSAGGDSQCPAMKGVHAIGVEKPGEIGRTTDSADNKHLMRTVTQFHTGFLKATQNAEVTTPDTPVRVDFSLEILRL
jgi:hypothetical protein